MAEAMMPTQVGESREPTTLPDIEKVRAAFPQLEILEVIGAGGMGVVYKARQTSLNRLVALKLLAPHREAEPGFAERFTREAQALAALNHPNIVTVHDFGQAGSFFFLLMEFIDGVTLREAMRGERFTPEQALTIVPPICEALEFAHERGIVHRDIKPENLLLDKAGRIKVADFGIARILDQTAGEEGAAVGRGMAGPDVDAGLTRGMALGTPRYMAPEQAQAPASVDHRADIYSLGVVFYEMLTGERPTAGLTPPSQKVEVDVRLDEVVLRALAESPEKRWESASELRTQVQTIATTKRQAPVSPAEGPASETPWIAIACAVVGTPMAMLGIFALTGVFFDPSWSPSFWEGVLTLGCSSVGLLLLAGLFVTLTRWKNAERARGLHHPRVMRFAITGTGLALCLALLTGLAFFGPFEGTAAQNRKIGLMQSRMVEAANARLRAEQRLERHLSEQAHRSPQSLAAATELGKELQAAVERASEEEAKSKRAVSKVAHATPVPAGILFAVVAIAALILTLVLLATISRGAAISCLALILLVALALVALFAIRSYSAARMSASARTQAEQDQMRSKQFQTVAHFQSIGVIRAHESKLTGEFTLHPEVPGWEPWFVVTYRKPNDGRLRPGGHTTAKVTPGHHFELGLHQIEWNARCDAAVDNMKQEFVLAPGMPVEILGLDDANGQQIQVMLELQPKADLGLTRPGSQLFIREVHASVNDGYIDMTWNELVSTKGYQLVLETWGASARLGSMPAIAPRPSTITEPSEFRYTRQRISGDRSCRFDFPPTVGGEVFVVEAGENMRIGDRGGFLFEVRAADSSYIAKAQFRIIEEDSATSNEILPVKQGDAINTPGAALPAPPPGAAFIAEQPVTIAAGQIVRILTEKNPDRALGELLGDVVFKTPEDDAQGIIIRWRGYPPVDGQPWRYLIDFVSRANGITFSRVEAEAYHTLSSPHKHSLPQRNRSIVLTQPHAYTTISLMRDAAEDGAAYSAEIQCEIQWIAPIRDPDTKPTFQLSGATP